MGPPPEPLRVGFVTGATPDKWAGVWRERYPRERLELVPVTEADQEPLLRDGTFDLALVRLAQPRPIQRVVIGQQMGGVVDEGVARLDGRPQRGGRLQTVPHQAEQPGKRLAQPPCSCGSARRAWPLAASRACSTRSSESAIASNRSLSLSPEAASGGRPSSVSALRTARQ